MAGLLRKFIAGAAGTAQDVYLTKIKDDLIKKRDERLRAWQVQDREDTQAHQKELQTQKGLGAGPKNFEYFMGQLKSDDPKRVAAAEYELGLRDRPDIGGQRLTANQKDVNSMVDAGLYKSEEEAWAAIQSTPYLSVAARIAEKIIEEQEASDIVPGDPDYEDFKTIFNQVMADLTGREQQDETVKFPFFHETYKEITEEKFKELLDIAQQRNPEITAADLMKRLKRGMKR